MAGFDPNDPDDHAYMAQYLAQIAPNSLSAPTGGSDNMDYAKNTGGNNWSDAVNAAPANVPSGSPLDPNLGSPQGIPMATAMSQPVVSQDADQTVMADPNAGQGPSPQSNPDVVVKATNPITPGEDSSAPPPRLSNQNTLGAAQDANAAAPPHHGLFHVSGTLRDVLGTLGDAFLTQAGHNSVYAPRRQEEKLSDALTGFNQPKTYNPDGTVKTDPFAAAITRVSALPGGAEIASKLYEQNQANQFRAANISSQIDARTNRNQQQHEVTLNNGRKQIGGIMAAATANPKLAPLAIQQAYAYAKANGLDPENELGLKPDMTREEMALYGQGTMNANQQAMVPIKQQNADAATQNAQARTITANKYQPSSARPAPAATQSNVVAKVLNKATSQGVDKLNPAEKDIYNRYGAPPVKKSRNFTGTVPPLRPGFNVTK